MTKEISDPSRNYFTADELKHLNHIKTLKEIIGDQPLHEERCVLLKNQLQYLETFAVKLLENVRSLSKQLDKQ